MSVCLSMVPILFLLERTCQLSCQSATFTSLDKGHRNNVLQLECVNEAHRIEHDNHRVTMATA